MGKPVYRHGDRIVTTWAIWGEDIERNRSKSSLSFLSLPSRISLMSPHVDFPPDSISGFWGGCLEGELVAWPRGQYTAWWSHHVGVQEGEVKPVLENQFCFIDLLIWCVAMVIWIRWLIMINNDYIGWDDEKFPFLGKISGIPGNLVTFRDNKNWNF